MRHERSFAIWLPVTLGKVHGAKISTSLEWDGGKNVPLLPLVSQVNVGAPDASPACLPTAMREERGPRALGWDTLWQRLPCTHRSCPECPTQI